MFHFLNFLDFFVAKEYRLCFYVEIHKNQKQAGFAEPHSISTMGWVGLGLWLGWVGVGLGLGRDWFGVA